MIDLPERRLSLGTHVRRPRFGNAERSREATNHYTLSVLVPTRNEAANIETLIHRVRRALEGFSTEVLFVDDSDDATPDVIDELIRRQSCTDTLQISLLHRPPGERDGGLGGAVVAGLALAQGCWVCVMDGDLQHPPDVIPSMYLAAVSEDATCVVASRYRDGGTSAGLDGPIRRVVSRAASGAAKAAFPKALRSVSDPMSGFFLFRRDAVDHRTLRPRGFKILMEIAVRTPTLRITEVPFTFAERHAGTSKANCLEGMTYARHLGRLRLDLARQRVVGGRSAASTGYCYDLHGILTVEADTRLPELEAFRTAELLEPADIRVQVGALPATEPNGRADDASGGHLRYTERFGNFGFAADISVGERIDVLAAPLLRFSPHVLYTNLVEPILRWSFVARGFALAHGACVVSDGQAFMITARTDTGKTTTMLKLLDAEPYEFVADDLTVVCPDGRVLPYPKPLTISNHTLHAVKTPLLSRRERTTLPLQSRIHSRSGRRFAFIMAKTGLPVATVNALTQLVVPPPKFPVQRLVPGVKVADAARLAGLFIIQRSEHGLEWLAHDDALEILLSNCEDAYGFPPYHTIEDFLLRSSWDNLREVERQVIAGAIEGRPAALLSSNRLDWATRIPGLIELVRTNGSGGHDASNEDVDPVNEATFSPRSGLVAAEARP